MKSSILALGLLAAQIQIQNFRFDPATIEVPVGATVTWVNHDEEIHALVASDASFRSPGLDGDETYAHEFDAPGTYEYRCALHPQMVGKIVVK